MMIIRLFCVVCAYKAANQMQKDGLSHVNVDMPMPITDLSDDGKYPVRCGLGHKSTVFLDNIKFELLFEMGVNALLDGYTREAVSSFASALERFYEFYWHVAMEHSGMPSVEANAAWKLVANQSERQLGMYVSACMSLTGKSPALLSANKEVPFRNNVIHKGYVPTIAEATEFGNTVMKLIAENLAALCRIAPKGVTATYERFSPAPKGDGEIDLTPWNENDEHQGNINHLCAIDVRHFLKKPGELCAGRIEDEYKRILRDRKPHSMELFATKADVDKRLSDLASGREEEKPPEAIKPLSFSVNRQFEGVYAVPFMGDHCAAVWPPKGWIIDSKPNGPYLASMYPSGLTQEEALRIREFMYVLFSDKDEKLPDLDSLIKMQDQKTRDRYRSPHFEYRTSIERPDCKTRIRIIEAEEYKPTLDCTLFLDFPEVVLSITLLSPKKDFDENLKKLEWVGKKLVKGGVRDLRKPNDEKT